MRLLQQQVKQHLVETILPLLQRQDRALDASLVVHLRHKPRHRTMAIPAMRDPRANNRPLAAVRQDNVVTIVPIPRDRQTRLRATIRPHARTTHHRQRKNRIIIRQRILKQAHRPQRRQDTNIRAPVLAALNHRERLTIRHSATMHLRLLSVQVAALPQVPLGSLGRALVTCSLIPRTEPINGQGLNSRVDRDFAPVLASAAHHRFMLRQHALG